MSKTLPKWREIQKNNFKDFKTLCDYLELSEENSIHFLSNHPFALNLPQRLARKIKKNSLNDPILLQFVAKKQELEIAEGFKNSPVSDESFQLTPKLLKKYKGRALLMPSSACAMHCRFCFRRNYPYETKSSSYEKELEILKQDPSIFEIILSGGDPLSLSDQNLSSLVRNLDAINHLKILRFHTRFPIGIPERITNEFVKLLESLRMQTVFVVHINHKQELDNDVVNALKKVQKVGIPILTHTVLLKGVNDSYSSLYDLFLTLCQKGFSPYYLNQLDKVSGGSHFEVNIETGRKLIQQLQENLPGYALPKYILEVPHEKHKTLL